jgi:hypothetical protein
MDEAEADQSARRRCEPLRRPLDGVEADVLAAMTFPPAARSAMFVDMMMLVEVMMTANRAHAAAARSRA